MEGSPDKAGREVSARHVEFAIGFKLGHANVVFSPPGFWKNVLLGGSLLSGGRDLCYTCIHARIAPWVLELLCCPKHKDVKISCLSLDRCEVWKLPLV